MDLIIDKFKELVKLNKDKLDSLSDEHERKSQSFRLQQLKRAVVALKQLEHNSIQFTSGKDLEKKSKKLNISGIGSGTSRRIDEILETGTLAELSEKITISPEKQLIRDLMDVHGIGKVTAGKLSKKVDSIDDLKEKVKDGYIKVTHAIEIGLKYYDDFKERIPHDDITEFRDHLFSSIKSVNENYTAVIAGSYRRGTKDSGDIDVLITSNIKCNLKKLVKKLTADKLLIDNLTEEGGTKYMGVAQVAGKARRIDILVIPSHSFAFALLYFTGSAANNVRMRDIAKDRGYTLNEHGMFKIDSDEGIEAETEEDIYDFLDLPYQNPKDR